MVKNMEKQKVICNKCGKELENKNGILHEDGLFITKEWGYFSRKDLAVHRFNLCEKCYDELVQEFVVPIEITEKSIAMD